MIDLNPACGHSRGQALHGHSDTKIYTCPRLRAERFNPFGACPGILHFNPFGACPGILQGFSRNAKIALMTACCVSEAWTCTDHTGSNIA